MTQFGKYGFDKGKEAADNSHSPGSHSLEKEVRREEGPLPAWFWPTLGGGGLIITLLIFIYWITRFFAPNPLRSAITKEPAMFTVPLKNSQVQTIPTLNLLNTSVPTAPGSLPNSIIDSRGVTMMFIPAGSFQMGSYNISERPIHTVTLDAFYMDIYQVTNALYKECVDAGACHPPRRPDSYTHYPYYDSSQYANFPVLYVSWNDALIYCQWRGARLPTEAEWEGAARGNLEGKTYPWGDEEPICTLGAQNGSQFRSCLPNDTVAVGSFAPNGYGLYDITGNVWEWVADWYSEDYYSASPENNPKGPSSGKSRVLRGGSFGNEAKYLGVANRVQGSSDFSSYSIGFRCAR